MKHDIRTRVWPTCGLDTCYPENLHSAGSSRPLTGVCFSGGSTRSYAATVGQLRGLTEAGLIERVGYVSAVSAGAWAATVYTYYSTDEYCHSDNLILGSHEDPEDLSLKKLEILSPESIAYSATRPFGKALHFAQSDPLVKRDEVWTRAVAETFLAPYNLFDPERPANFSLNAQTVDEIKSRNPVLRDVPFQTVRSGSYRPYLLIHATLNWPEEVSGGQKANLVGFEYSPLGIGSPESLKLETDNCTSRCVGGGFIEPFAFGSATPKQVEDEGRLATVELPEKPFALADAIGASSAFSEPGRTVNTFPHYHYWPVGNCSSSQSVISRDLFTDGGDVDNYGLIALLRRRVKSVIVFVNTGWRLSMDYDPANWPIDPSDSSEGRCELDPSLAPLFGAPSKRFPRNHVFPAADFSNVVSRLQDAKSRGEPVMTTTSHVLQSNSWWGISGGTEVTVCWVYNELVDKWVRRLPQDVQQMVQRGNNADTVGPFARFPHYLTRGQNTGSLIRLTAAQVNLLAHLSCWNVLERKDELSELLAIS